MTTPRKDTCNPSVEGTYHCWSRCVRRAFLCGVDRLTGRDFGHRKKWVEERLQYLSQYFAISVLAYAIMENHNHAVLKNSPSLAQDWSPTEVAYRWRKIFPKRRNKDGSPEEPSEEEIQEILDEEGRVETLRKRLSDISWFMRCLNENIARRANQEDKVTGRFWEGRFKSTRLDNSGSVLSCMVYVDLNPIRAGKAKTPEESEYTSVFERILKRDKKSWLVPVEKIFSTRLSESEYLTLVDRTGRELKSGKRGHIDPSLAPILERLGVKPSGWKEATEKFGQKFRKVAGTAEQIRKAAEDSGRKWFWGTTEAAKIF